MARNLSAREWGIEMHTMEPERWQQTTAYVDAQRKVQEQYDRHMFGSNGYQCSRGGCGEEIGSPANQHEHNMMRHLVEHRVQRGPQGEALGNTTVTSGVN